MKLDLKISNIVYYMLAILIIGFGLFLRIRLYLNGYEMWGDEFMLHYNILGHSFSHFFKSLDHTQIAPPLYLCLIKILTDLFGSSVYVLKFVSIVSGCLSLLLFDLLLKKTFNNKLVILFGLILFAINIPLICYSNEFKPYALDVLGIISLFLFYDKINFDSKRKMLLWSIIFFILPFFSFSAFIAFGAILLLKTIDIITNKKLKSFFNLSVILLTIFISAFILYKINNNNQTDMFNYHSDFFLKPSINSLNGLFIHLFGFMNYNGNISLFFLYLGIISALFDNNKTIKLSLFALTISLFASFIHVYPFFDRLILFIIPIFIILFISILDVKIELFKIKLSYLKILLIIPIFNATNFNENIKFVLDGTKAIIGHDYIYRNNIADEINKFLKMYKIGEKYIYTYNADYSMRFTYYDITKKYNYGDLCARHGYFIHYENDLKNLPCNHQMKIASKMLEKELRNNKKDNYWISSHICENNKGLFEKDKEQELFIENVLNGLKIKYKIIDTKNGNLYYIERGDKL